MTQEAAFDDELLGAMMRPGLRIDERIGAGSFGTVYRGFQVAVEREVAVKVLHPGLDPEPAHLFREEIRAIGKLDHPNVVRIFDADETSDGRLYFVMEMLRGSTLQKLGEAGRIPLERAIELLCQLLDGLAAVHAAGHIHADVKPSNVVLVESGTRARVVLIDFGLSRLRQLDRPAEAVGGTLAFMAPEQLRAWQLDPRSDVFSAALVLVYILTGWLRTSEREELPPLDRIEDLALRVALDRALSSAPADRPSAADFARALRGGGPEESPSDGPPLPFRQLAPFTEQDRRRLHGRHPEVLRLARSLDSERAVVLTAPSGTGKTSLLRAGLIPYLDAAGDHSVYLAFAPGAPISLAKAISPGSNSLSEALARWVPRRARRLVLLLDQIEILLGDESAAAALLEELLASERRPHGIKLAIVLAVREDFVARLIAVSPQLARGVPQVRIDPLTRNAAAAALTEPLAEHQLSIAPALRERLLDDLVRAGRAHGASLGWPADAVYPPHLQLAGAALFAALTHEERTITLTHYERLGGFEAIVGEMLARLLDELSEVDRAVARGLFLSLVASSQTRELRSEEELLRITSAHHDGAAVRRVLERLEGRRLLTRRLSRDGQPAWELIHDSLVPRIEAWLTVQDLDRRRAAEVLRFHLRESSTGVPSLLSARQLRLTRRFLGVVEELDLEWENRPATAWTPSRLVTRSRLVLNYRRSIAAIIGLLILGIVTLLVLTWMEERSVHQRETLLRDRDLGRFDLVLAPFDWAKGVDGLEATFVDAAMLPTLTWDLYEPDANDPDSPGEAIESTRLQRGNAKLEDGKLVERGIQARGGDVFLVISGRGKSGIVCAPSIVPIQRLPGYAHRAQPHRISLPVPTCQATRFGMADIAAGPFVAGGPGEPLPSSPAEAYPAEQVRHLPFYRIDRMEISNAAFSVFANLAPYTGIAVAEYPAHFPVAAGATYPRTDIDAFDAGAFCRFLGKELPSSDQWQKALRGGLTLPDGAPNPMPRRNLPWGEPISPVPANLNDTTKQMLAAPVGSWPRDVSPYGVLDLAGNVQEWTSTPFPRTDSETLPGKRLLQTRVTRGGNWFQTSSEDLVDFMATLNERSPRQLNYFQGARCSETPPRD